MKEQGWIRLHRKIRENWIWQDPRFKWWLDLLLEANHEGREFNIGNMIIRCERGQTAHSLRGWASRWGVSKSAARAFLILLKNAHMIMLESRTKTTLITISNYDLYQASAHDKSTITKRSRNDMKTHRDPNNNDLKNEKNTSVDSEFDLWWKDYPRQVAKQDALKAWQKAKDKPPVSEMIEILKKQCDQEQWQKENGKFIPYPATYLNKGRWEDEIEPHNLNKPKFVM